MVIGYTIFFIVLLKDMRIRKIDESSRPYHEIQYEEIYESTKILTRMILDNVPNFEGSIIDAACGGGANTLYLGKLFPQSKILGLDIDSNLLKIGKQKLALEKIESAIEFRQFNLLEDCDLVSEGVVSFQALSFISNDIYLPLKKIGKLASRWFAFSTLIYDGPVDAAIQIIDWSNPILDFQSPYNILSLEKIKLILTEMGFRTIKYTPFNIKSNLQFSKNGMGSKTFETKLNQKLIFSGPLFLPYGFIFASKDL
jgi:SAM-dependent methyltransferase